MGFYFWIRALGFGFRVPWSNIAHSDFPAAQSLSPKPSALNHASHGTALLPLQPMMELPGRKGRTGEGRRDGCENGCTEARSMIEIASKDRKTRSERTGMRGSAAKCVVAATDSPYCASSKFHGCLHLFQRHISSRHP